jgi:glycosyltransferase involved in cell wall biosynthesis
MLISPYVEQVFGGLFRGRSYLVEAACDERFFGLERQVVPGRLLFTGLLVKRKGILPLLQALALVRRERPEAHLHLVGPLGVQPDYALACEEYARAAGLEGAVTFLGHIPQEQLYQEYAQCAALVLPSFQETAPSVIQQAMACGAPCVALRAGGVPWMLEDGVTGLTLPVPPTLDGDPPALAAAILRLLNDEAAARAMGARARVEARKRFWPADVARRTVDVYRQVINS